ncbi:MAG: MFS transporter [Nitrososphaerales archaeon]|nr:MFS transporter [Nitrososphaerales archaeon]
MEETGAPRKDLAVLYVAMLVSRVGFGVIIILFPLYIARSSDIGAAVSLALYPAFEAASAVPMGRLCDTRGRKVVFVVALGYMAALMATVGLTRNLYVVSGIHALMGVGAAGVTVASLTMITDMTRVKNRGKGMGTFDFANIGGYALGLFLGGRLQSYFSAQLGFAFFATGGAVAVAFLVALIVLREPVHVPRPAVGSLNPLKALDGRAKATIPIWLGVTIMLGIVFFLPRALTRAGLGEGATANLLFLGVVVLGLGSVGFGALSDLIGRTKVMLVGVFGLLALLTVVGISFAQGAESILRYFPAIGLAAIGTSALVPTILATVGDRARSDMRGSAMSVYSVMLSLGTAIGTLVAGVAHSTAGLSGIFYVAAAIFGGACLASLGLWRRAASKEPGKPL